MRDRIKRAVRTGSLPGIEISVWAHNTVSEGHCILMQPGLEGLQGCILFQHLCKVPAA